MNEDVTRLRGLLQESLKLWRLGYLAAAHHEGEEGPHRYTEQAAAIRTAILEELYPEWVESMRDMLGDHAKDPVILLAYL